METVLKQLIRYLDPIHHSVKMKAESLIEEEYNTLQMFYKMGIKKNGGIPNDEDLKYFDDLYHNIFKHEEKVYEKPIVNFLSED